MYSIFRRILPRTNSVWPVIVVLDSSIYVWIPLGFFRTLCNIDVLLQLFFGAHVRWSSTGFLPHLQPSICKFDKTSLDTFIFWKCHTSCIFKMHFPFSTTLAILSVHHVPLNILSSFVRSDAYRNYSMGFSCSGSTEVRHRRNVNFPALRYHMTRLNSRPEGGMSILAYP